MPWVERSVMDQRLEFVSLASAPGANLSLLCRRFGVSRPTAYKWLARHAAGGPDALADRSRRPHASPGRASDAVEAAVLAVRDAHPAWGGRKIRAWMQRNHNITPPAASTITAILRRHGRIDAAASAAHRPFLRFEDERPNGTWQMDFKGHVAMARGGRCHPLTVLDDHSRYCIALRSCADETDASVRRELVGVFDRYGLPERILCDNGSPWGSGEGREWTALEVWLLEHGVGVVHGRPYHPQTQGKDERFHRTLKAELLSRVDLLDAGHAQTLFDPWRHCYNTQRPHEALGMATPVERYRPSVRSYDPTPATFCYDAGQTLRTADRHGRIMYRGRTWRVGRALAGRRVALRPAGGAGVVAGGAGGADGELSVCLGPYEVARLDLRVADPAGEAAPPARRRHRLAPLAASGDGRAGARCQ